MLPCIDFYLFYTKIMVYPHWGQYYHKWNNAYCFCYESKNQRGSSTEAKISRIPLQTRFKIKMNRILSILNMLISITIFLILLFPASIYVYSQYLIKVENDWVTGILIWTSIFFSIFLKILWVVVCDYFSYVEDRVVVKKINYSSVFILFFLVLLPFIESILKK